MGQKRLYDFREKPDSWEEYGELVNSSRLRFLLRQQLILIAFTAQPQVSVRAIAMLLDIPIDGEESNFAPMTMAEIDAEIAFLKENAINEDYAKDA
jgi:hypothetical protein